VDFLCYLWLVILLFLRPGDFFQILDGIPLFWISSIITLLFSFSKVAALFSTRNFQAIPTIPLLFLVWLVAIPFSLLAPGRVNFQLAYDAVTTFYKPVSFFLFTLAIVDTPKRVLIVCKWIPILAMVISGLALYDYFNDFYFGVFTHARETNPESPTGTTLRLAGHGSLADPNDFAVFLVMVSMFNFDRLLDRRLGIGRVFWLIPLGINTWAFSLTESRGAFVGLLASIASALFLRFGVRRSLLPLALILPIIFVGLGGRQTNLSLSSTTATQRIEMVGECYYYVKTYPVFGLGYGQISEWLHGLVAHNTYMQSMAELGFFGGSLFSCFVLFPLVQFLKVRPPLYRFTQPEMARLYLFLGGALAGFNFGILSLSRAEVLQTYLLLGLGTSFIRVAEREPNEPLPGFSFRTLGFALACGLGVIVFHYVMLRYFYGVNI